MKVPHFLNWYPGKLTKLAISKVQKFEQFPLFVYSICEKEMGELFKGGNQLRGYIN